MSIDDPETSRQFVRKIEGDDKGEVDFTLLSDPGSTVIDRYGLRDPRYAGTDNDGIPRPAVFVLDEEGVVRWRRIETDYTQRPSVDQIESALDEVRRATPLS